MPRQDFAHLAAIAIKEERYPDTTVVFAAGSIFRGEDTPHSDLDLVVIHHQLPHAYRESFRFRDLPVEAFVHDPETLKYFFFEVDRPSGVPSLAQMVLEGIEIPNPSDLSRSLKAMAASMIDAGPSAWTSEEERIMRYRITDAVDDLRQPRSREELTATGTGLYKLLAVYYCRSNGRWSAAGKSIPRLLRKIDSEFHAQFSHAFSELFEHADQSAVIALAGDVLRPNGGWLFEGHRSDAPEKWRSTKLRV
jgi:predicted nucleotidyltransferase